jgi:hypothetical protein
MRSPARRPPPSDAELHARLAARIEALEDRVRQLEVRVSGTAVARRVRAQGLVRRKTAAPRTASRPQPRCPGCTLELPPGRKGEACVWCGFQFDAVRSRKRKG